MATPGSQQNLMFIVILALILVFALPMFISRRGGSTLLDSLFGKRSKKSPLGMKIVEKREPHLNNGTRGELTDFVASLLRLCQRKKMGLVVPGTVQVNGQTASTTALVVAPARVVGVCCYGFAGRVVATNDDAPWKQERNGQQFAIPNAAKNAREQAALLRTALDSLGHPDIPVEVVSVYTSQYAELLIPASAACYSKVRFLEHIKDEQYAAGPCADPIALSKELAAITKRADPAENKAARKAAKAKRG